MSKRTQEFSPSGLTPKSKSRIASRLSTKAAKRLFPPSEVGGAQPAAPAPLPPEWSRLEEEALLVFISRQIDAGVICGWPAPRAQSASFWLKASDAVSAASGDIRRSGEACIMKVRRRFRPLGSVLTALKHYGLPPPGFQHCSIQTEQTPSHDAEVNTDSVPSFSLELLHNYFEQLPSPEQVKVLESFFTTACKGKGITPVPHGYIQNSLSAMQYLQTKGKSNILAGTAYVFGNMRPGLSDSRFPTERMPFGLFEHCINFYRADSINEVPPCPLDYLLWQQTMYNVFGVKWLRLHHGPGWSTVPIGQERTLGEQGVRDPMQASINIPSVSERTLRRMNGAQKYDKGPAIQVPILAKAASEQPGGDWWIKADSCDLSAGLMGSVQGKWGGDVDLNNGEVTKLFLSYKEKQETCRKLGLKEPRSIKNVQLQLQHIRNELIRHDMEFVSKGLQQSQNTYQKQLQESRTQEALKKSAWNVDDYQCLYKDGQDIVQQLNTVSNAIESSSLDPDMLVNDIEGINIPRMLSELRSDLILFEKNVFKKRRTPASHILVIMISDSLRRRKPYALPLQCIPHAGLRDMEVRQFCDKIKEEMIKTGMAPKGLVTDGEFNSLRSRGATRPLSVLQIRSESRNKFAKLSMTTMQAMITITGVSAGGTIQTAKPDPSVPQHFLQEILLLQCSGNSQLEAVDHIRQKTVPVGYSIHPWTEGLTETPEDSLRSILAQAHYTHAVREFDSNGVPFRTHCYVPEEDALTKKVFHEREDHAHLLKRIAITTREGRNKNIRLERFSEALGDPASGLTLSALTGVRKQSVSDAERLFSKSLCQWFKSKGYTKEAEYVEVVNNWHRANDERGLTEDERSCFNYNMLNFILDDLMPWYKTSYDLSLLEVNRPLTSIQGFTRETTTAILTNIESEEWERKERAKANIPPENPRASTTDDIECFFSVMRDLVGNSFTLKKVQDEWKKICIEFEKRERSDLPFFYFSAAHDRFYEGERPQFNANPKRKRESPRPPQRETQFSNSFAVGRVSLPNRGEKSKRLQFHSGPVALPTPPALQSHNYYRLI